MPKSGNRLLHPAPEEAVSLRIVLADHAVFSEQGIKSAQSTAASIWIIAPYRIKNPLTP